LVAIARNGRQQSKTCDIGISHQFLSAGHRKLLHPSACWRTPRVRIFTENRHCELLSRIDSSLLLRPTRGPSFLTPR
jgi:hypothetical protein